MAPLPEVASTLGQERDFHHPYQPYDIQKRFMSALYDCIKEGKVGIFESPTGTGKSLSLICGSLTWLRDHQRKAFEEGLLAETADDDEPEWIVEHAREQKRQAALRERADLEARLAKIRAKEKRLKERYENGEPTHKKQKQRTATSAFVSEDDEARFTLDDYESDDNADRKSDATTNADYGLSAETQALMSKLGMPTAGASTEDTEAMDKLKIFYCSRTHSQLTQFAGELNRVKMPPALTMESHEQVSSGPAAQVHLEEGFKHLTLGSRKNLCINQKVNKLTSATAINERCLELQQPKTPAHDRCPFLPRKESEAVVNDFRDHALAKIRDIEDLGKSAREALGLSLKGHVIIIDEAHNVMDAITGIYSISVSHSQLQRARAQLGIYLQKFRNRLKGKNRVYVTQIVRLLDSLTSYLQTKASVAKDLEGIVQPGDLMSGKGVDQINLYKLMRYLRESKLARKVDGYIVYAEQQNKSADAEHHPGTNRAASHEKTVPVLTHIQGFLAALMNPSAEGRFFYSRSGEDGSLWLKYMLLDPTHHFREIVEQARAVILAGGTMSPMSDYEQHLFSYLPSSRITTLSCGHVIPASSLFASAVEQGPSGVVFDFTFEKRSSEKMIVDLGLAILSFVQKIPDGVVIFFPGYAYLGTCIAVWKRVAPPSTATKHGKTLYEALTSIKPIFHESPNSASHSPSTTSSSSNSNRSSEIQAKADSLLTAYSSAVTSPVTLGRGALLLAVIGGSLSEGINFSDALGRGVMVVGLPFPNPHSAEWKARMQYIANKPSGPAGGTKVSGKEAAKDFYENTCMRAVNQCIGRAIRHKDDYASILLIDRRYTMERIQAKLPGWIKESLVKGGGVGEVSGGLRKFFEGGSGSEVRISGEDAWIHEHIAV
ncbi:ATP-dependent DNA helicase chl1 [Coniosporium tulheliwenetii]|uniref:ATP-dependent DNA helicase chl1 n=1 Tax=Coniosporium tulheliwenetii TaxID=3383036 RepID=A0ACC2ZMS5_9PEZI|nr:ATP-dependent DNA helicase chl1 [Cladosporium sp. JES 115]